MDCQRYSEDLTAYIDGELPDRAAKQLRSHLEGCVACAADYHSLQEATVFVDSHVRHLEPRPEMWKRVSNRIARPEAQSPGFLQLLYANRWVAGTLAVAAALMLIVGVGTYLQRRQSEKALEEYMTQYIEVRRSQDQISQPQAQPLNTSWEGRFSENPFVTVSEDITFKNPFRENAR